MALPVWFYRDPLEVLERIEGMQCTGCKHEEPLQINSEKFMACAIGRPHSDQGGRKCRRFKIKEAGK